MGYQLPVVTEPRTVHELALRDGVLRTSLLSYRIRTYIDVRVWCEFARGEGLKPTKMGFRLPLEHLADLEAALSAVREACRGIERSSSTWDTPR